MKKRTMKTSKRLLALLLALALAFTLAACSSSSDTTDTSTDTADASADTSDTSADTSTDTSADTSTETASSDEPVYGGSLTVYFNSLGTDYDPSAADYDNYMLWYERLFEIDWSVTDSTYYVLDTTNMSGQIAESYEWDSETMQLTVTIRDDIYFQTLDDEYDYYGGRQLVASDVKWSYDRVLGTGSGYDEPFNTYMDWTSTLYMIESIETDGDYTVIFQFNTDSEVAVSDFIVAPLCIAGPEWDELTEDQQSDWHYACGTGPYILSEYDGSNNMTLVRNDNYYDYDERYPENQLPYLDSITLVKVDDTATLMTNFIAGQVDFIGNNWSVFSISEAQQIQDSMDESEYVIYNLEITGRGMSMNQNVEALQNETVREALQYAINIQEIAEGYFELEEWSVPSLFSTQTQYSTSSTWDDELTASFQYDPEKAMELLEEAGYGDGFEFTFTYVDSGDATDLYLLVQQQLAAVGVTLNLEPATDHASYIAAITAEDGIYSAVVEMGVGSTSVLSNIWRSGGAEYCFGSTDEMDALIDAISASSTIDEQTAAIQAVDQYVAEEHMAIVVTPAEQISYFTSSKIGGYNGENLYVSWNIGSILARVWSTTGE